MEVLLTAMLQMLWQTIDWLRLAQNKWLAAAAAGALEDATETWPNSKRPRNPFKPYVHPHKWVENEDEDGHWWNA